MCDLAGCWSYGDTLSAAGNQLEKMSGILLVSDRCRCRITQGSVQCFLGMKQCLLQPLAHVRLVQPLSICWHVPLWNCALPGLLGAGESLVRLAFVNINPEKADLCTKFLFEAQNP